MRFKSFSYDRGCAMAFNEFPDDVSLRFRAHVLCVYAQSTLQLAAEIAADGPDHLSDEDLKLFDDLADACERIFIEAVKVKRMVRG
jgi:hypothetical protein